MPEQFPDQNSLLGIFLQCRLHKVLQTMWPNLHLEFLSDYFGELLSSFNVKWILSGDKFVSDNADTPDIDFLVVLFALQ